MNSLNKTAHIEEHPDWYFDIPVMKTLILGSYLPSPKRYSYPFYYPNKINHFWKILADIARVKLKYFEGEDAVTERKKIMLKLKVGVQNMGKKIKREGKKLTRYQY
jgi:G:T/U-mismatch repair DNA glycosylase